MKQQYAQVQVYRDWVDRIGVDTRKVNSLTEIPFLPISFFKTHDVLAKELKPEVTFTSSGTTGSTTSRHLVASVAQYEASFMQAFQHFYGDPAAWAIIGLLPSYLERQGSSLVYMVDQLITASQNPDSGTYLYDHEALRKVLERREANGQKTWLIGVTYALLDFAARHPMPLQHTIVVETGGMKGRREEMTRAEVHQQLKVAFGLSKVHSEYGMTELLSQAYSKGDGVFQCSPWMRVLIRAEDDPRSLREDGTGAICIIDLANRDSCAFIATDDLGRVHPDGTFEILGRMDDADIRGCSLLVL